MDKPATRTGLLGASIGVASLGILLFAFLPLAPSSPRSGHSLTFLLSTSAVALLLGYLAWRHRSLFVTAVQTAAVLGLAAFAGFVVWTVYLLAITPTPPPGAFDWTYGYSEDAIHFAILLAIAASTVTVIAIALFIRHRTSRAHA